MSAQEPPAIPDPDQPPGPDHQAEMEEIERLKVELGDRVGMLRDARPRADRRARLAAGAAVAGGALAVIALARSGRR